MKNFIVIVIIFVFSALVSMPLLKPGYFTIHDDQQFARLFVLDQALKTGQFPVRWVDGLGFGFGYPLFVFYPPLVYYLGEVFHLFGFGFIDSIKLVVFSSIFFSGITMYIFSKNLWGKAGGLIAALFYIYAPYRALDVYVRGALAESFTFVWIPLIFWGFLKIFQSPGRKYITLSSVFLALLMITHNLIFLPFMMLLPIYLLFLFILSKNKITFLRSSFLAIAFSAGLSAFFYLPSLVLKGNTIVDDLLIVNLANYNLHFVYPTQLWNWPWGFGGSAGLKSGISFKIGKLHVILSSFVFLFWLLSLKKSFSFRKTLTLAILLSFVFSAFMTTYLSKPIWDVLTPLAYLQFPWRFLTLTVFFASLLAGACIYFLKLPILKLVTVPIIIILLTIPNIKLFQPQKYRSGLTDATATSKEAINWEVSRTSYEYAPKGVELIKNSLGANQIKIAKDDIPTKKLEILQGQGTINLVSQSPTKVELSANLPGQTKLKANIFNFPGWKVKVDNNQIAIDDNNSLKLITFNVTPGQHNILIEYKDPPIIKLANIISLFSIIIVLLYSTFPSIKKHVRP